MKYITPSVPVWPLLINSISVSPLKINEKRVDSPLCWNAIFKSTKCFVKWNWNTGNVICLPQSTVSMYHFIEYREAKYLLIQWKSGDYIYGGEEHYWYVFRKEDE